MQSIAVGYQSQSILSGTGLYFGQPQPAKAAGPTYGPDPERTHDKAQAYTDSLALRLNQQAGGEDKDASALATSLMGALETIGAELGDAAATAAIGIIARNVGEGEITEEALGNGLLDVLRFVDRNFGTTQGDKLISTFNGALNDAVNQYFDNGLMEKFYAVDSGAGSLVQAVPQLVQQVQNELGDEAASTVADLLEQGLGEGVNYTNFRKSLARAKNALARDFGPGAASVLAHAAKGAFDELESGQEASPANQPGMLLDVAV